MIASPGPTFETSPKVGLRLSDLFLAKSRRQFGFDAHNARVGPAWGSRRCLGPRGGWSHVEERLEGWREEGRSDPPAWWLCLGFPRGVSCWRGQQSKCSL